MSNSRYKIQNVTFSHHYKGHHLYMVKGIACTKEAQSCQWCHSYW